MIGLCGVVIGALLGGGAQILASSMQDRRRHQQWLREQRASVYRSFLAEAEHRLRVLGEYFDRDYDHSPDPPEDYVVPLFEMAEDVGLFGTVRAHELAKAAAEQLLSLLAGSRTESDARYRASQEAIAAFRTCARANLVTGA